MTINKDIISDIMSLPYYSGELLEHAVNEVFESHCVVKATDDEKDPLKQFCFEGTDTGRPGTGGVSATTLRENKEHIKYESLELLDMCDILDDYNYYIWQPLGRSSAPDRLYIQYGSVSKIEDKSSASEVFRFNNTLPKPQTVYIFSSKRMNTTRVCLGIHLTNDYNPWEYEEFFAYLTYKTDHDAKEYALKTNREFCGYVRRQFDQIHYSNVIEKSEKNDWHIDVINYLDMQLSNSNKKNVTTQPEIINTNAYDNVLNYHR